jgi:hypothetical protein
MSRARHRLTASKQALHHARHTYQDDGGGGGDEIIVETTGDKDSYLINESAGYQCSVGNINYYHQSWLIHLGCSNPWLDSMDPLMTGRPVIGWDLDNIPSNAIIKSAVCRMTINHQWGAANNGGNHVIIPYNVKIYRCKRVGLNRIDQTFASWCHFDNQNEWSTSGAGVWDNMDGDDVDLDLYTEFLLGEYNSFPYALDLDFQELVQDAVSNRNGELETFWIRDNDLDETFAVDPHLGGENNSVSFYSSDHNHEQYRPKIIINYYVP